MSPDLDAVRASLKGELGGDFELGDVIGEGGFAIVFRARDTTLNRDVAVKVLNPDVALDPTAEERFRREARTIASLEHPHIVPVFRAGVAGRMLYIVMRFVEGHALSRVLEGGRPLPWAEATRIAIQVADALAYAHSRGVVHRDIKPDNLLVDSIGNVLVTDFGIARLVTDQSGLTVQGTVSGTYRYMSPEQALGDVVDARADVYALGVVLYEMLTGRVPFDGGSAAATLKQQLTSEPRPIEASSVPVGLRAIVARTLASAPEGRFATAAELRDALVDFRASVPPPALRRRSRRLLVGSVLLAISVTAIVVFRWWASREAVAQRAPAMDFVGIIPDTIVTAVRSIGDVDASETVRYVFSPAGATIRDALVVTDRRIVRLAPSGARAYALTSVRGISSTRGAGFVVLLVDASGGGDFAPDTLFVGLGDRERLQLFEKLRVLGVAP